VRSVRLFTVFYTYLHPPIAPSNSPLQHIHPPLKQRTKLTPPHSPPNPPHPPLPHRRHHSPKHLAPPRLPPLQLQLHPAPLHNPLPPHHPLLLPHNPHPPHHPLPLPPPLPNPQPPPHAPLPSPHNRRRNHRYKFRTADTKYTRGIGDEAEMGGEGGGGPFGVLGRGRGGGCCGVFKGERLSYLMR
jgi:hypothetical protein